MKIVTIVGARPQFIKAAAVSRAIADYNIQMADHTIGIHEFILHTGQHYDDNMSPVFFKELEIKEPDLNLEVGSGSHGVQTGQMLAGIESTLLDQAPDWVIVYGDTNSTLAGALAASKLFIPIVHVEAGLRSFNRHMPEEINRLLIDHMSHLLFCPTISAVENLRKEGIGNNTSSFEVKSKLRVSNNMDFTNTKMIGSHNFQVVMNVGDVMYDSVLHNIKLAMSRSNILEQLKIKSKAYAVATVHRSQNTDNQERLKSIFNALNMIAMNGTPVIMPLHPRTKKIVRSLDFFNFSFHPDFQLLDPISYLNMLRLEKEAKIILTDSGGVQKEAFWLNVPCVTLRNETEWQETVTTGWNVLTGADSNRIVQAVETAEPGKRINDLYGDGQAAKQIVRQILNMFIE